MPFGLTNAPSTFQRLMNQTFFDILDQFVVVYLDDILVLSSTLQDHLQHLRTVLSRLRKKQLCAKLKKCSFLQTDVEYLGHIVGNGLVRADPTKLAAIREWPTPTNVKHI